MQARGQHIERTADRLTVTLFLIAIALPAALCMRRGSSNSGDDEGVAGEQRRAARAPSLPTDRSSLEGYPGALDAWYADAFGFRQRLVRWHNVLTWFGLGTSGSGKVVRAKDGWLFYRERRALECSLGAVPMTPAELEAWRIKLEARRDWCAARGIEYLFVSAPAKAQIYPEFLPDDWKRVGPSRLDQLHEHLDRASDIAHLDLRPALLTEKARGDRPEEQDWLYFPLGTHWSSRGSVVAYREIVRALSLGVLAGVPVRGFGDFRRQRGKGAGDSWAERLYLDGLLHQTEWLYRSPGPVAERSNIRFTPQAQRFEQPEDPELPRLVLYHDSFAVHLRSLLARHFSRVSCYWTTTWQPALLIEEHPNVVIDFMAERMLHLVQADELQVVDEEFLAALFAGGQGEWVIDPLAEGSEFKWMGAPGARVADGSGSPRPHRRWPLFELSGLRPPEGFDFILELDLEAPEATTLELSYPGPGLPPRYRRGHGSRVHVEPGRQRVHVLLRGSGLRSAPSPSVRAGAEPGESGWVVHRIRVRTTPAQRKDSAIE